VIGYPQKKSIVIGLEKKGLPVARVISHFDLSAWDLFHEHWIGPGLLSFQMGN
jgi:hypothetical protein